MPIEERNPLKQEWNCTDYLAFDNYQISYLTIGWISKLFQLLLFVPLLLVLISRNSKINSSSKFPILIASFAILDAIFTLLKIDAIFPLGANRDQDDVSLFRFAFYQAVNNFFFLSTFFLFGMKYHKTATEI